MTLRTDEFSSLWEKSPGKPRRVGSGGARSAWPGAERSKSKKLLRLAAAIGSAIRVGCNAKLKVV